MTGAIWTCLDAHHRASPLALALVAIRNCCCVPLSSTVRTRSKLKLYTLLVLVLVCMVSPHGRLSIAWLTSTNHSRLGAISSCGLQVPNRLFQSHQATFTMSCSLGQAPNPKQFTQGLVVQGCQAGSMSNSPLIISDLFCHAVPFLPVSLSTGPTGERCKL